MSCFSELKSQVHKSQGFILARGHTGLSVGRGHNGQKSRWPVAEVAKGSTGQRMRRQEIQHDSDVKVSKGGREDSVTW